MKIIFLDLEGVVVSHKTILLNTGHDQSYMSHDANWARFVDKLAIQLIFRLADEFDANIVLTSTLRSNPKIIEAVNRLWTEWYADADLIYGVTGRSSSREQEIADYLIAQRKTDDPVDYFVVIDDRRLTTSNFVQTDPREGFSYANYQECRTLLADDGVQLKPDLIFL